MTPPNSNLTRRQREEPTKSSDEPEAKRVKVEQEDAYDAITKLNALKSPLLRLPPELRNKIYHYAIGDHTIRILPGKRAPGHIPNPSNKYILDDQFPARVQPDIRNPLHLFELSKTCRTLYSECKILPFRLNTFKGVVYLKEWLLTLNPDQIAAITTITEDIHTAHDPTCILPRARMAAYSLLTGLERVIVYWNGRRPHYWTDDWKRVVAKGVMRLTQRTDMEIVLRRVEPGRGGKIVPPV